MAIFEELKNNIAQELMKLVGPAASVSSADFVIPPQPEMGDFSYPCFSLAKARGVTPQQAASELARQFPRTVLHIARVEAAGPYVNFFLNLSTVSYKIVRRIMREGAAYGAYKGYGGSRVAQVAASLASAPAVFSSFVKRETIMLEYSQPNTHKEFHVGHLRNTVIGWALIQLLRSQGHRVIAANYQGDIGAHVAKCLWALKKFHDGVKPPANKGAWLGAIYTEATKRVEENPAYKEEVAEVQRQLEARDPAWIDLWKKTRGWCLDEFRTLYRELGVKFDHNYFESEVEEAGKRRVAEMLSRGVAHKSEGAVIMDLAKENLGVFLLLKSDGSALYSTKEIELAYRKFADYKNVDHSIVITDDRQSLYFKQLFATLRHLGFDKKFTHLPYAFVTLPEGAMSSRAGNIVRYEYLRSEMVKKALEETAKRHQSWPARRQKTVAHAIALAAIKFAMLKQSPKTIITFDMGAALSFDGFTGPYLLYTYARTQSILKKAKSADLIMARVQKTRHDFAQKAERALVVHMGIFPEVVGEAAGAFDPALVARYLFELGQRFAEFYETAPVLAAPADIRRARLLLVAAAAAVVKNGLHLLGIETVREM